MSNSFLAQHGKSRSRSAWRDGVVTYRWSFSLYVHGFLRVPDGLYGFSVCGCCSFLLVRYRLLTDRFYVAVGFIATVFDHGRCVTLVGVVSLRSDRCIGPSDIEVLGNVSPPEG